jgi:hypothetical protein
MPTTAIVQHISERKHGLQLSAPTQSDGAMACTRRSEKAKPLRRYRQIRGYRCHQPRQIREFQYSRLSETTLLSAGRCLRSGAQGWNPGASHPRKGKTLKSTPIGRFPNSRAEPMFERSQDVTEGALRYRHRPVVAAFACTDHLIEANGARSRLRVLLSPDLVAMRSGRCFPLDAIFQNQSRFRSAALFVPDEGTALELHRTKVF